ncbi:MAG: bifunctional hydroxymethylpyrimidine kinase/phosphomethylpyrimidine kinase, partial [Roseivirga sp.]|nr:bifunctional hydroxymethylpyrimidine kinase/phosphomethylpyrimidine kinase [Roseivirga sp.]
MTPYNSVLTIAGSDSGGGAGIQADIKSISACGAFAASVITATTAQNTQGVLDIHAIPMPHLELQLEAVLSDIEFGAIKIGMLHSCEVIEVVQSKLL